MRKQTSPRQSVVRISAVAAFLAAANLLGCGNENSAPSAPQCQNSAAPGTVSVFAAGIGSSEGIAFLDGELYVAGGVGSVRRIAADGSATPFADIPASVGMVAWHGALYVAGQEDGVASAFCAPTNQGVIWKVTPTGERSVFARGFISPNFIVATPWDTLLVSDDCITNRNIYEVDAQGTVSTWNASVLSANGMAFDPTNTNLFVVNTFVRTPMLHQIAVAADHTSGATTMIHSFAMGTTPDGIAVDVDGGRYVALNIVGKIDRVAADGTDTEFASGMISPASLAFGDGPDFDACSMYVTSLTGTDLYRVEVGSFGVPLSQ